METSLSRKIYSLFLLTLLVFTIASSTAHKLHEHDSHHNALTCSACLLQHSFASALPAQPLLLPEIALTEFVQTFADLYAVTSTLAAPSRARAPPLS